MNYQPKTLFRIACVIGIAVIAAFITKIFFSKSEHTAKAPPKRETSAKTYLPGPAKKRAGATAANPGLGEMPAGRGATEKIAREEVEREDEDAEEDPVKIDKKAVLERQIQELTQEKEKGQQELNKLLAAVADAQNKSQLSVGDKQGKEYEVLFLKLYMIRMVNEKLASIDSSVKEKLTEYNAVIKKPDEPLEQIPDE